MAKSFLQSRAWGEVQAAYGREVRWVHQGDTEVLAIRYALPRKQSYWFIPQGPLTTGLDDAMFVRYEPTQIITGNQDRQVADVHPSQTLVTALTDPATMLAGMKQKCRYNLKIAQKKKVQIFSDTDPDTFYQTLVSTSERQQIRLHPKRYYQTMLETLQAHQMVKVYRAEYDQHVVAVAMVVYYDGIATYVHGGSDYEHRAVMAPYLLHWQAMQDALAAGCHSYDWFGISDKWPGVTRFKLGFGGDVLTRPGTFDHVQHRLWYTGYRLMKTLWTS